MLRRRSLSTITAVVSLLAATAMTSAAVSASADQVDRSSSGHSAAVAPQPGILRPWTPAYMDRSPSGMTRARAVGIAQHFDLIAAKPKTFAPYVADMRAANRNLRITAYYNAVMADSTTAYPSSWYLRDASGNLIKTVQWDTYAMNPGNPAWVADRVQACRRALAQSGYDGCFLDSIGRSVADGSGYVTGRPINPETGQPYTVQRWLEQTAALSDAVRSAISPKITFGNNLGTGTSYFDPVGPTSQLLAHNDLMMVEGFVRKGRAPLTEFNSPAVWLLDVKMLQDASRRGAKIATVTKTWNTGTQAQKDALHAFALGTFLLGADGSQRFSFLYDELAEPTDYSSWWDTPIGTPTGTYAKLSSGLYARSFSTGYVVVNPTANSRNLTLSNAWVDVRGSTYGPGRVAVAPHSALILHR